jgi:hypothetical protein
LAWVFAFADQRTSISTAAAPCAADMVIPMAVFSGATLAPARCAITVGQAGRGTAWAAAGVLAARARATRKAAEAARVRLIIRGRPARGK